jgi:hypothetical protein
MNSIVLESDWRMKGFGPDVSQDAEKQDRMVRENM